MSFAFNPFTGTFDLVGVNTNNTGVNTDHHTGIRLIEENKELLIEENKESRLRGYIKNYGTLRVEGVLIID